MKERHRQKERTIDRQNRDSDRNKSNNQKKDRQKKVRD